MSGATRVVIGGHRRWHWLVEILLGMPLFFYFFVGVARHSLCTWVLVYPNASRDRWWHLGTARTLWWSLVGWCRYLDDSGNWRQLALLEWLGGQLSAFVEIAYSLNRCFDPHDLCWGSMT